MEKPETFYPASKQEWRQWLHEHHAKKTSIWVICYKKETGIPTMSWSDGVDEALCYGWIDSTRRSIDKDSFMQFYARRKPKSTWSKINKDKVERLIAEGLMMPAGLEVIATAKKNGSWASLDVVEDLTVPKDLEKALKAHKGGMQFFAAQSKTMRKAMLHWLAQAKRPETRQKRIDEIAVNAGQGLRPERYRV